MLGMIEGRRRGRKRMRWLDDMTDSRHELEQTPGYGEGQGSLACCSICMGSERVEHERKTERGFKWRH